MTPPANAPTATKLQVEYGGTVALGSSTTIDCASVACVASVSRSPGELLYWRWRWLNASNAEVIGFTPIKVRY